MAVVKTMPWTSEAGRYKVVASVAGGLTSFEVVDAAIGTRQPWFPVCHIMVPAALSIAKFEWFEGELRAAAGAWALAGIAGYLRSGRLFTQEEKFGFLPSATVSKAIQMIAALPASSGDDATFEVGAEGEDGALLAGMLREMDGGR